MADAPDPLWDGTPHWEKEPEVAEKYILYLDQNVEKGQWESESLVDVAASSHGEQHPALPNGCVFQAIIPHGASYWTRTAQIKTQNGDKQVSYFLKVGCPDVRTS